MALVAEIRPPGPRTRVPGGNLLAFRRDPLGFLTHMPQDYGDIAHFRVGPFNIFLLNHPDMIKDVLVTHNRRFGKGRSAQQLKRMLGQGLLTSEGTFHLRQRRLAQPAFHRQRIAAYGAVMAEYAQRQGVGWPAGAVIDVAEEMMRLTLSIVGKTLFDTEMGAEAAEIRGALTDAMEVFMSTTTLPFGEYLEYLPVPSTRRFQKARTQLDTIIYRIINARRADGEDRGDLLSMLLLAQDPEAAGGGMTDLQIRDEAMTLFLAGHETTANALTWTWYLLSQHSAVEAQLHAELARVLGGRLPTAADLPLLPYTEMVLSEAMRLYPPVWVMARRTLEPHAVGDYVIPPNSGVLMSPYVMQHDPRYYPDPERFDPERWTPQAQASRPKFAYFPFGGGPRVCIGESFAWMEGILVLATLAQAWQLRLASGHPVALQPLITLRPRYGMRMLAVRRDSA